MTLLSTILFGLSLLFFLAGWFVWRVALRIYEKSKTPLGYEDACTRLEALDKKVTARESEREWTAKVAEHVGATLLAQTPEGSDGPAAAGVFLANKIAELIRTLPRDGSPDSHSMTVQ